MSRGTTPMPVLLIGQADAGPATEGVLATLWKWTPVMFGGFLLNVGISVLAMAIGTALTVSAFATLAVTAKAAALRLARDGGTGLRHWVEIAGAAAVMVLGLVMLSASLSA